MPSNDQTSNQPCVLVVDDESSTRMIAREFLTQAGFLVEEACDGNEALATIEKYNPDLFLLDVEMPGMNGFELCRSIRNLQQYALTPILMLTGLDNTESIDLAYEAGATDFATKPINWSLLCYRLRYMLRSSVAERKVHQLAYYDTVTGLANRTLFNEVLQRAINNAKVQETMLGILYFDLDDFKRINDIFGHSTGDRMLQSTGKRITACLEERLDAEALNTVTLARMGGDEFTILLENLESEKTAIELAKDIISSFVKPFQLDNNKLFSSPSVGLSFYPRDGDDIDSLLSNADMAMYEAKRGGKNSFSLHNSENLEGVRRRHSLSDSMRLALKQEEFSVHYQPQLDLQSGRMFAAEALMRWQDVEMGTISPAEFIPLAEENGLIVPLGDWVLRTSCLQARRWLEEDFFIQNIAVNISVLQFMQAGFVDNVAAILEETKLQPEHLELEITESLLATDINNAITTLKKLKDIGVKLSIDDFGTGYSSLSQIKHFPIDRLKIDQSFIRNITRSKQDASITRAIIAMADSLGIRVLAEGVESIEDLGFLKQNRCDEIQGYLISKAQSAEKLSESASQIIQNTEQYLVDSDQGHWKKAA